MPSTSRPVNVNVNVEVNVDDNVEANPLLAHRWATNPDLRFRRSQLHAKRRGSEPGKLQRLETLTSQELSAYGYDATGHLATVSTSAGVTTGLDWDGPALTSVSTTWPNDVSRTVTWNLGDYLRVSSEHVTGGRSTSYGYDADGLITQAQVMMVLDPHPLTVQRHAKTGWVTSTALKKISQVWGYDAVYGELQTVNTKFNGVDNVHTLTLETYDDLGRITTKKDKVLAFAQTSTGYGYDSLGRLTSAGTTSWGYDPNGNRTHINGVVVASYDEQDRILTHQGAIFTHDLNGHRETKLQSGVTTTYHYDEFGNLQSVLLPGGPVVTYDIDGAGRRVGRHKTGGSWRGYLLGEGNRVVAEYNEAGTIVSQFVYATRSHVPDFMIQGSNVYRFITDQLGSVRLVVNVNGSTASASVVQRIDYDAWGNVTNTPTSFDQPFGFAGGLWDRDTGLVHFGAREYDPVTGRWLQKDPIRFRGGDTNLYAYVGGDPVNRIDPSGLAPGDPYDSSWDAAAAALRDVHALGRKNATYHDNESGGLIYQFANGKYSYTPPVQGSERAAGMFPNRPSPYYVDVWDALPACQGNRVVGDYHTHSYFNPYGPGAEQFSSGSPDADIDGAAWDIVARSLPYGYTIWLGTPAGRMGMADPLSGIQFYTRPGYLF